MLTEVSVKNFKAFQDEKLKLGKITVLLGPNNSGKSSIISVFKLLTQTVDSNDKAISLLLNGIMGDFGTYRDIVFQNYRAKPIGISISCIPTELPSYIDEIRPSDEINANLIFKYRPVRRELILKESEIKLNRKNILSTEYSEDTEKQIIKKIKGKIVPNSMRSNFSDALRMTNFLPEHFFHYRLRRNKNSGVSEFFSSSVSNALDKLNDLSMVLHNEIRRIEYIGAMRVFPERTFLFAGENRSRIGAAGENTANILAIDDARSKSKSKSLRSKVSDWLTRATMASDIKIVPISDRYYEIRVQHPITKEYQNFADVGFGHSQILPVLVAGYNLTSGQTLLVEQPEIHLHPKAQAELGSFFYDLYCNKVQTIIETHSEHLILRLQQYVAEGLIYPEDLSVYYIYPTKEKKVVKKLNLDNKGFFVDEWPEGFFPERLEEAKKLAKARHKKDSSDTKYKA